MSVFTYNLKSYQNGRFFFEFIWFNQIIFLSLYKGANNNTTHEGFVVKKSEVEQDREVA